MKRITKVSKLACRDVADPQYRARFLLRATKAELEKMRGRTLTYEELGHYAGQAASTVFKRLQNVGHPPIEGLLSWLERLPEDIRHSLVNRTCRCFPHLNHVRLSYDPAQVSALRALVRQVSGLSIVRGDDGVRTFVMSAFGHEAEMERGETAVLGLDLHRPDWFVPLGQVKYLYDMPDTTVHLAIRGIIGRLLGEEGKMILVNAAHPMCQEFRPALNQLARKCHVVMAEDTRRSETSNKQPTAETVNVLTVSLIEQARIRVSIQRN
jgi:hypothetical protein